jgi:hypothetical protein
MVNINKREISKIGKIKKMISLIIINKTQLNKNKAMINGNRKNKMTKINKLKKNSKNNNLKSQK